LLPLLLLLRSLLLSLLPLSLHGCYCCPVAVGIIVLKSSSDEKQ
jgi:hypothetical protein